MKKILSLLGLDLDLDLKGIVSRKLYMLFWYHSKAMKFLLLLFVFYSLVFIDFLKYHRFRIEFLNIRRSAVRFY
jgi:hypothetical protein